MLAAVKIFVHESQRIHEPGEGSPFEKGGFKRDFSCCYRLDFFNRDTTLARATKCHSLPKNLRSHASHPDLYEDEQERKIV